MGEYDNDQLQDVGFEMLSDDRFWQIFGDEDRRLVRGEFRWNGIVKRIEYIYLYLVKT